jgi:hypothetical protein
MSEPSKIPAVLALAAMGIGGFFLFQKLTTRPLTAEQIAGNKWNSEHQAYVNITQEAVRRSDGSEGSYMRELNKLTQAQSDMVNQLTYKRVGYGAPLDVWQRGLHEVERELGIRK